MAFIKKIPLPYIFLAFLIACLFYEFFIFQKVPVPADTLVGAYWPWLDYKWGFSVGVPVKNALISDVFSQFFLWKYLGVELISKGIFPLWNIYSFSGTPLLASYHAAPFLPFNLLLLLPKYYGWGLFIFMQTLLAASGMYLLIGCYTNNYWAKILGALVFSLSGLMTTWLEFGTGVYAAALLPFVFYSLEKFIEVKKWRYLILLSISYATLFLAGHAQITLYSVILMLAYLVFRYIKDKLTIQNIFLILFFLGIGIGLVSLQFFPAYDLAKESIRANEAYSRQFNYGLNPVYEIVRIFAADFFGNPVTYNHWDTQSYHEQTIFLGSLTLPLIVPLIFKRFRNKFISFWGSLFFFCLILGFENPISVFVYSLPLPFLTYSSASRIFFLFSFSAGILSGFALDKLVESANYRSYVLKSSIFLICVILGVGAGFLISTFIASPYVGYLDIGKNAANYKVTLRNIVIPLIMLTSLIFLLNLLKLDFFKRRRLLKIIPILLILLTFFDLGRYFLKYNPFVVGRIIFPETPVLSYLKSQTGLFRIARIDKEVLTPNTWIAYKLSSIEGYDPLALESYGKFFNRVNGMSYYSGLIRYMELNNYPSKYLDALNVKYLLTLKRDEKGVIPGNFLGYRLKGTPYKKIFEDKTTVVLENPSALGRAYFIPEVKSVKSNNEMAQILNQDNFDPTKQAIVVSNEIFGKLDTTGEIKILSYTPNEIKIQTKTAKTSFMILADSFEKGWKLLENGKKTLIYPVDGALRGVKVTPGENMYTFYYFPDSFNLGLKLSIISLIVLFFVMIFSLNKKRF